MSKRSICALLLILSILVGCGNPSDHGEPKLNWPQGEWNLAYEAQEDVYYQGVCFADADNGWVVGWSGRILHTDDGGHSWGLQESGTSSDLECVYFINAQRGWIGSSNNTIGTTTDGGASWSWQQPEGEPRRTFMDMSFVDENTGWIVDNFGGILHTQDGGVTWTPQSSSTQWAITSVQFLNTNEGWATATNRIVLRTTDGGQNWTTIDLNQVDYGATVILEDIFFIDGDRGWISTNIMASSDSSAFENGSPLLYTTDGGETWQIQTSLPASILKSVRFIDQGMGWVASDRLFYSEDGGNSWTSQSTDVNGELFQDICLVDNIGLWTVTFTGKIYHYRIP